MTNRTGYWFTHLLALPLCVSVAFAQTSNEPQTIELGPATGAPPAQAVGPDQQQAVAPGQDQQQVVAPAHQDFSQEELDQMLAPIALYPDTLLSQILMASTYPIEVVQAARWSRANPGLTGDQAVKAVETQSWDPSVKSLVAFPNILSMMDEKLDWMERIGDAFLAEQAQVMATVQQLRQRAQAAGNLQSNDNIRVEPQGQTIVIEQANPQVVYVPYYDPTVIYGPWWYPAYPPVFWRPWPGYYARPGWAPGFFWGSGIAISAGFFFGRVDWPHRHVGVVNVNNYYYRAPPPRPIGPPGAWFHDPAHRRGVPYRDPEVRREFARAPDARPDLRRDFRGNPPPRAIGPEARPAQPRPEWRDRAERPDNRLPATRQEAGRPEPARPQTTRPESRTDAGPPPGGIPTRPPMTSPPPRIQTRPDAGPSSGAPNRPAAIPPMPPSAAPQARVSPQRPMSEPRPHVFEGVGQGPVVRDSSQRGRSSQQAVPVAPAARTQQAPRPAPAGRPPGGGGGGGHGNEHQQR